MLSSLSLIIPKARIRLRLPDGRFGLPRYAKSNIQQQQICMLREGGKSRVQRRAFPTCQLPFFTGQTRVVATLAAGGCKCNVQGSVTKPHQPAPASPAQVLPPRTVMSACPQRLRRGRQLESRAGGKPQEVVSTGQRESCAWAELRPLPRPHSRLISHSPVSIRNHH